MKNILLLFIFLLLYSCNSFEEESIDYLNEGIVDPNQSIYLTSIEETLADIEFLYKVNADRHKYSKEMALKITQRHDSIENTIDLIKNHLKLTIDTSKYDLFSETNYKKNELLDQIVDFKTFLISITKNNKVSEQIFRNLDIEKYREISLNIATLNIIYHKANKSSLLALIEQLKAIKRNHFYFNKYKIVIIPKSRTIFSGDSYEAQIFLTILDSTREFKVITDNDTLLSQNGIVHFEKETNKTGVHKLNGKLIFLEPDEEQEYPFLSNYKVIKK